MDNGDLTQRVEETFDRIWRERMEGLPILNPALAVEAVGLQRWNGHWVGMLITPWAMSVLLLPADPAAWVRLVPQQRRFVTFPFGDLAFLGGEEPDLGEYQTCSLFSPMDFFATQAQARDTARVSLVGLLAPAPTSAKEAAGVSAASPAPAHDSSRRRFLRLGA